MRILVTGAHGFAGRHLRRELAAFGHEIICFDAAPPAPGEDAHAECIIGDATDAATAQACVKKTKPDACAHLAGMAFVPAGWDEPEAMLRANTLAALNFLVAFRQFAPQAIFLYVGSAEVYGSNAEREPVPEEARFNPTNIYAATKAAADTMVRLYAARHDMRALAARPCNHIGPGQDRRFVLPAFAAQVAECVKKGGGEVRVGNLESARDFLDVRDVARAYRLLLEKGVAGEAYNIASGREYKVKELLEMLFQAAGIQPRLVSDPKLCRPADRQPLLATAKIKSHTGWTPAIPLEQTVKDTLQKFL